LVTFAVSGIWHGAGWSFLAWGLLHGVYQILGDLLRPARAAVCRVLHLREGSRLRTVLCVC
jgi:D-alanyl-lipoteichoic acid acyltransferase DltB (MBOAT superfamily)